MNEDEALSRFGPPPIQTSLDEIRMFLLHETEKERSSQGSGDTEVMKLLCVYLFSSGSIQDSLLVWDAKTASMDADASIDIQLLCGRGLLETRMFLDRQPGEQAIAAAERLSVCEAAGDFDGFDVENLAEEYTGYYSEEPE